MQYLLFSSKADRYSHINECELQVLLGLSVSVTECQETQLTESLAVARETEVEKLWNYVKLSCNARKTEKFT